MRGEVVLGDLGRVNGSGWLMPSTDHPTRPNQTGSTMSVSSAGVRGPVFATFFCFQSSAVFEMAPAHQLM